MEMACRFRPNYGVWRILSSEFRCRYSTTADTSHSRPHFLLDYLTGSLGFSKEEAIITKKRLNNVSHFQRDPDLVVNFLSNLGLNKTQIKSVVMVAPRVLGSNVDDTLAPKIRVLQDLGISGPDLVRVLMYFKSILILPKPSVDYFRNLMGSDELVAKLIKRRSKFLDPKAPKLVASNVELLQGVGFSREKVASLMLRMPSCFLRSPEYLQGIMDRVENDFGISRQSKMFYHGVVVLSSISESNMAMKFEIFRSFGWSNATIYRMLGKVPYLLRGSENKIRKSWNFFVKEIGYPPDYLANHPVLVNLSFERRVKPRTEVLNILKDKKLIRKFSLCTVLLATESKFLNNYLLPYKDKIPEVYDSYCKKVGREEAEGLLS